MYSEVAAISRIICLLGALFAASGAAHGQSTSIPIPKEPTSCEDNESRLDNVLVKALENAGDGKFREQIIVISHLGDAESNAEVARRRLHNAREYLLLRSKGRLVRSQIVVAQGERVAGLGRIEVYLDGKILEQIPVGRGKPLCVDCCENYKLPSYKRTF